MSRKPERTSFTESIFPPGLMVMTALFLIFAVGLTLIFWSIF
jgi:hypothetical protein